jgi:hypothetical protein
MSSEENNIMSAWSSEEKKISNQKYGCEILVDNGTYQEVSETKFPNDARIVKYFYENKICYDLTRSPKASNIFDMYWDKFRDDLKSINFGFGKINPKLWQYQKPKEKRSK